MCLFLPLPLDYYYSTKFWVTDRISDMGRSLGVLRGVVKRQEDGGGHVTLYTI